MSPQFHSSLAPTTQGSPVARLERAHEILSAEIAALGALADQLDSAFESAVDRILECPGKVIVTGIGKAGIVGQKLSASFSSTGTPSHFLHPGEAVHGDLGCVRAGDVVVLLSYSGETEEIIRLLPPLNAIAATTIAITAKRTSTLGQSVDLALPLGKHPEACRLGLAPTSSTTSMMALGDALALVTSECRGFSRDQFARFHPGGSLGRQLMSVRQAMRPLAECRVASEHLSVREVLVKVNRPGRRTGAIMLLNSAGKLVGIFTDSDLARLLERQHDGQLDEPISEVMTRHFHTVDSQARFSDAWHLMAERKISELPVVDANGLPAGILDITDVVGLASPPPPGTPAAAEPLQILSITKYQEGTHRSG